MAQLAYVCEGEPDVAPGAKSCEFPVEGDPSRLVVSLFAESEPVLATMAQDTQIAGLAVRTRRSLTSLLERGGGVLGDIVLVDCPKIDGAHLAALARLDERAARSGASLVVATVADALEDVFGCLDRSRPDILVGATRAQRMVALGGAMARMPGRRLREADEEERIALLRLAEEVERLAAKIDGISGRSSLGVRPEESLSLSRVAQPTQGYRHDDRQSGMQRRTRIPLPDPRLVKSVIRHRAMRAEFFDEALFADPAWDILLDLTAARAEHRRVSVTSLCIAANVPATTALRWISQMVESGILVRVQDDSDKRRAFIALSDGAADAMARYFDAIGTAANIV
ncbi:winged helix DNA-binding protein [Qipengyuania spongiae]|uniref:Winged helix DNA-binding protein n=1 Tax=Qipengyuania spongiae TaxID=2909673 RepID=A0ABY5T1X1_9SPHN|nr:winged helix DNA-binding protein [Qipengyuania spongiae]UVI40514.1 winged helix DNA-binding protein [Qipengyuania spongiae]